MIASVDPSREGLATNGHLDDLKLAASKMKGAERRAFQAAMAVKYCGVRLGSRGGDVGTA
jgi:hypothetical protein